MAVAHQLVGAGTADAGEDEVPDGVLQHGAVADFPDVVQVRRIPARPGAREAHIAKAPGNLGQTLPRDLRVRLPGHAVVGEEPLQLRLINRLPADEVDGRLVEDADFQAGDRGGSHGPSSRGENARSIRGNLRRCQAPVSRPAGGAGVRGHPFSGSVMLRGFKAAFSSPSPTTASLSFFFNVPARIFSRHSSRTVLPDLNASFATAAAAS